MPAQAPRGLSRRSAARKGPAKSLHSPRERGRWRERPGPFRRLLDAPLPGALPAGRPEASALASGGRGPEEGKAIMSHFSVLVLTGEGQDVEGLLLPYMENCCGEPPREYMEFFEDEECEVDEERGARGGADGRRGELRRRARGRLRPRAALRGPRSAARHGVPPEVRPHGERRALGRGEQLRPGRGGRRRAQARLAARSSTTGGCPPPSSASTRATPGPASCGGRCGSTARCRAQGPTSARRRRARSTGSRSRRARRPPRRSRRPGRGRER